MKRVISLVLCLMLVLGLATTAFAAEIDNPTKRAYKAYQVFEGQEIEGSLTFKGWGNGVNGAALLLALKDGTYKALFQECETAGDVANVLLKYPDHDPVARHFANVAALCITGEGILIAADATSVDLGAGYYVLIDQTEAVDGENPDYFVKNAALLQVSNKGKLTMSQKVETPQSEKNILSTDDQGEHNHTTKEDYAIGDAVEFHLRAELPNNVRDFDSYRMVFHDAMSEGLTFVNDASKYSISVTYTPAGASAATTVTVPANYYTVTAATTDPDKLATDPIHNCAVGTNADKNCDVHFVIDNVFDFIPRDEAADAVFVVHYQAILNEDAKVTPAEVNDYTLEFSNDPNWNGTGEHPTGITPWDEVEVYTTEIVIEKIDGLTGDPLTGAEFTLTGTKLNKVRTSGVWFDAYTDTNYDANNKYWLMTDNTYTAVDPSIAGIDTTKYADTTTVYKKVEATDRIIESAEDVAVKAFVDKNGKLTFSGLAEGAYTITESTVPAGYNPTSPVNLTIMFDEENAVYTYQWSGGNSHSVNTIKVANYSGSELPETGGIGTTLFYIIGGLLFAGSAVLLITKKRMSAE